MGGRSAPIILAVLLTVSAAAGIFFTNSWADAAASQSLPGEITEQPRINSTQQFIYDPAGDLPVLYASNISAMVSAGSQTEDGWAVIPAYRVRTNAKGFREEPFSAEKPPGQYRIIVVGDSITFG